MSYVKRFVVLLAGVASGVLAPSCSRNETNGSGEKQTEVQQVTDANESVTKPVVVIETSMGTVKAELWADKAPGTVENFLTYVDDKFYDGLIFHRVMRWPGRPTRTAPARSSTSTSLTTRGSTSGARMRAGTGTACSGESPREWSWWIASRRCRRPLAADTRTSRLSRS